MTQTTIHGSSDIQTCAGEVLANGFGGGADAADSSLPRSAGDVQITFGCQILRKPMRQPIEISEAPISTIHGMMKLEMRNCGMANETPVTRMAGQISRIPL